MDLIVVTRDPDLENRIASRPVAGLTVSVTLTTSVARAVKAAELHPATLVVIDLNTITLTPVDYTNLNPERLVTLGPQPDPLLTTALHLAIDAPGNFWTALLLYGQRLLLQSPHETDGTTPSILTPETAYAITESASIGMVAVNDQGRISDISEHLQLTFSDHFDTLLDQPITTVMGNCQPANLKQFIRDSTPGSVAQFEFVDNRQDPPTTWLLMGHLVVNTGTQHLVGVVRNITPRRLAEAAVRDAAAKNQTIFDTLPDGICVLDHEFKITACNVALADMLGYPHEELIGHLASILTGAEYWAQRQPEMIDTLEHQTDLGQRKIFHRDGHTIDVEVHQTSIGSGHHRQYYAAFRDLRERQAAKRELRTSEIRYKTIFSAIPDGIAITNQAGEFLEINHAYSELTGYSREELLGKNISILATDPEGPKQFYKAIASNGRAYAHTQLVQHDGQIITMTAYGSLFPANDPDALPDVVLTHRNLTALTGANQSRQQLSDKLDQLIAATPLAVFELDTDSDIVSWNPAAEKLFGYSIAEACQRQLRNITPPARHHILDGIWSKVMADPTPFFYLGQGLNRAGEILELEWYITPITAKDGEVSSIIALANDITDRRQLELQVRQAQKIEALGQLAGGVAHDFNNILTGILGYSELAAKTQAAATDTRLSEYLASIHRAGSRGRDLIRQILNYSRVQPLNLRAIDPEPVVTEVLDMLSATLPATIIVQRRFEPNLPTIDADPTQLYQVVMNICINAKDAMPDDRGVLQVELAHSNVVRSSCHACEQLFEGEFLRISIQDDGTGIAKKVIAEMFNPFFTTKEVGRGTGMGLAVADGIIHSLNGHLHVHSSPATGTRFDIYIPIAIGAVADVEEQAEELSVTTPGDAQHLLLVDDEPSVLALLQELFSAQGYQVTGCASGSEALQQLSEKVTDFDLVITDYSMPGMTGVDLATELYRRAPQLPVVLCTGYMLNIDPVTLFPGNIREQLQKPVPTKKLFSVVQRLLAEQNTTPPEQPPVK
ncbi:MAG: hypothetical protein DRQ60_00290 [Gammaproteobacteria bacterium]|nr:MAG: hypothetical protein DRQ52_05760 [Gammaproteobacteria bacterium]RLA18140.1 MAG: hypothetical protein DRQ60_00290 [Gammaproteobacteria bacterium]